GSLPYLPQFSSLERRLDFEGYTCRTSRTAERLSALKPSGTVTLTVKPDTLTTDPNWKSLKEKAALA
ncbi:MAG TPA: hypothetical protein VE222_07935, partial [Nitrospiraceae bacterium]|nr:hypothetical protein [Nitrospiraceae bacterium]